MMLQENKSVQNANTGLLIFLSFPIISYYWYNMRSKTKSHKNNAKLSLSCNNFSEEVRPPFPPVIRNMLSTCRLAYLSTAQGNSSHLSLMRLTYCDDDEDGEVVIMTTNKNTKKFEMLKKQNGVAILIHDFPQFDSDKKNDRKGVHSITLNGRCIIMEDGPKTESYRARHLEHNPDYPQFIIGPDIMVLCVAITSARICNIKDEVTKWSVNGNS